MFCKHNWKVLSEITTESLAEKVYKMTGQTGTSNTIGGMLEVHSKKLIQIVTCTKCGKLKRFVEKI